jgi:valyl-tRNA synthetase/predicted alpha/beta hydrolase family esterase
MPLQSNYNPKEFEANIYTDWQQQKIGNPDLQSNISTSKTHSKTHSILMPPPNLTGNMHAGHSFQHFAMDTLSRLARQKGQKDLWFPGVDHAGLQLEGVIDKMIRKGEFDSKIQNSKFNIENVDKEDLPKFLKSNNPELWLECAWSKVNEWRNNQQNQAAVLGDTPDYSRSLFTLDEKNIEMVNYAFRKYWQDGLIYKGSYLVNWSVGLQTALSDVSGEIEYEKRIDPFITFEYRLYKKVEATTVSPLENYESLDNSVQVGTVRPETIFGDYAIAIHPEVFEKQYSEFSDLLKENKFFVKIPLTDRFVPVILADEVDPNFGSGALKITPASDIVDYDIFNKYIGGDFESAIGRDGKLTNICGEFVGQTVSEARLNVIKSLVENGFVPKKENNNERKDSKNYFGIEFADNINPEDYQIDWNYEHNVTICERTKTVVEPLISEEFFISYHNKFNWTPIAKDDNISIANRGRETNLQQLGIEAVKQTKFYSVDYQERGINFLENIKDWCISRDLIWGHKMPVWYNLDLNPDRIFYSYEQVKANPELNRHFQIDQFIPEKYGNWVQEEKILDTWFSSCLWSLSTLGYTDFVNSKCLADNCGEILNQVQDDKFLVQGNNSHLTSKTPKPNIVFVHGGEVWLNRQDYRDKIQSGELNSYWYSKFFDYAVNGSKISWKTELADFCKANHINLIKPQMPNKTNADYDKWKWVFEQSLPFVTSQTILVGHSLGSMFLTRYLSENKLDCKAVFLVSGGINTNKDSFNCPDNVEHLFAMGNKVNIVHSDNDEVLKPELSYELHRCLPQANLIITQGQSHLNSISPELLTAIKNELTSNLEFVIIHGSNAQPLANISQRNWLPWLKQTLENKGYKTFLPELSNNHAPSYEVWKQDFERQVGNLNPNSVVVAHSAGGPFFVRYLSEKLIPIKKLILMSPSWQKTDDNSRLNDLLNFEINPKLRDLIGSIVVATSDNEPEYRHQNADFYISKLGGTKKVFQGLGHFITSHMGRLEFPEILELLPIPQTTDFETFYPTQEMLTAKEIFYQWIIRMTTLSYYFTAQIPYTDLIITPTVLDEKGKKMSKSLGNGLEPVAQINKYSSDSLRMAMLGGMIPNRNMKMGGRLADELCEKYRNFGNKMWNIARFFEYQEQKRKENK